MGQMKKFGFVLLVVAMSVVEQLEGKKGYEKPVNCGHLECAQYRVIQSQPEFEIRNYAKAMWVATSSINSASYKDAVTKGFNILFAYIQGNNHQSVKINMTAPVLVNILPPTEPHLHNLTFVVHFYLPQNFQNAPPQSAQAHPVKLPQHKFAAVKRFGGFMDDSNICAEMSALKKSLKGTAWDFESSDKHTVDPLLYTVAGYNSPFEHENRVNEVMLWFD